MSKSLGLVFALILGAGLGIAGFWLVHSRAPHPAEPSATAKKPLYYRHPMNPRVTSPTPAKDEMGMDYIPVYREDLAPTSAPGKKGRILYYRHPMGAADTSPVPKKDEMGMDYIPVYEGEVSGGREVSIAPEKIQKLGVRTETLAPRRLVRSVRALGGIQVDERRVHAVAPKFEGWVQRLRVNATGQRVERGQILLEVYSPDLLTAQQEYLIARQGVEALRQASPETRTTAEQLVANSLSRLRYWDIAPSELRRLENQGAPLDTLPLRSPLSGFVLEKPAVEGMRFMPGEVLYRIADLGQVWLLADVFEQDLDWIRPGQEVSVHINAYPEREFGGRVEFIYPTLATETRTVKVRIEMPNREGLLRPGLYGSVSLAAAGRPEQRLAVPDSAVLDSGARKLILVQKGEGVFEPREVRLGRYADGYFEVLEGASAGETVVTRANFLIDAESRLKSALDGMAAPATAPGAGEDAKSHGHRHGDNADGLRDPLPQGEGEKPAHGGH
jgi:Cu(I)/Ag(I) efflux system membrane fusion protein